MVIPYQCFGTMYQSHHQEFLTVEPIGCPKMSVRNYHSMLHNISEDCRHHLRSSRSQKSHNVLLEFEINGILWKVKQKVQYVLKMQKMFLFPKHNQPLFHANLFYAFFFPNAPCQFTPLLNFLLSHFQFNTL